MTNIMCPPSTPLPPPKILVDYQRKEKFLRLLEIECLDGQVLDS